MPKTIVQGGELSTVELDWNEVFFTNCGMVSANNVDHADDWYSDPKMLELLINPPTSSPRVTTSATEESSATTCPHSADVTTLTGKVRDQAELQGVRQRVSDLELTRRPRCRVPHTKGGD